MHDEEPAPYSRGPRLPVAAPVEPRRPAPRPPPRAKSEVRPRASPSRLLALALSTVFALIGLVPIALGAMVRTSAVRSWAAAETARLVHDELGLDATYELAVHPWPLGVELASVVVEGSDGRGPALTVERLAVRPRVFSLLAGRLDVGDVELVGARARVVLRDGALANVALDLPASDGEDAGPSELPLSSVTVTDLALDLDLEGTLIRAAEIDVDLLADADGALEGALRAGGAVVTRVRPDPRRPGQDAVDEDRLCRLETRVRVEPRERTVLVRRLALGASVDLDPDAGTRPACDLSADDWRSVEVGLGALRVRLPEGEGALPTVEGRVRARVPAALAHRFVSLAPATGNVEVDVDVSLPAGAELPEVEGRLRVDRLGIDGKVFASTVDAAVAFRKGKVLAKDLIATWGDGVARIAEAEVAPFEPGIPLRARDVLVENVTIAGILRELGVHPQSHVGWRLERTTFTHFGGTISPLALEGPVVTDTRGFAVYDRPAHRADRRRMTGVDRGHVEGTFAVTPEAVVLRRMHLTTGRSDVLATVSLGYASAFGLEVHPGSRVDLGELSPLVSVSIGGEVDVTATGSGTFSDPVVEGAFSISGFELGGFRAGDIRRARARFVPLVLELADVELAKNASVAVAPRVVVDFDSGADVLVDADVDTRRAPHFSLRDFFEVFHFDEDPRFADIAGLAAGTASVHYALGGPEDRCGGGFLDVRTRSRVLAPEVFGEKFEDGELDVRFRWDDQRAGDAGMHVDVVSARLRDGPGSVTARARVVGGKLSGDVVGSGYPLSRLEGLGRLGAFVEGEAQVLGTLSGTLSRPEATLDVGLGPLRLGADRMPSSRLTVRLEADPSPQQITGRTTCGAPITPPFSRAEWERDAASGRFVVDGQLFDGQVRLEEVAMTKQRDATVTGRVLLSGLDIDRIAAGLPGVAYSGHAPSGSLSATIDVARLRPKHLAETRAEIELFDLSVGSGGRRLELTEASAPVVIADDGLVVPRLELALVDRSGLRVEASTEARIDQLTTAPTIQATLDVAPLELERLAGEIPGVERLAGTLTGGLAVEGPLGAPRTSGSVALRRGALGLSGLPLSIEDVEVDVAIGDGEIRLSRGTAKVGAGTVDVTGRAPLSGFGVGVATATISARGIKVPVDEGIELVTDADLQAVVRPSTPTADSLPEIRGDVRISSFTYARPISLSLDLGELTKRIRRPSVEAIDPDGDVVRFDLMVRSGRPLTVRNDLFDVRLEVVEPGIQLSGTNQRYGARGSLRILPDSKMRLRNHEFDVREGSVRFEDPSRIRPEVDVRATTELRRYASNADSQDATDTSAAASSTVGGQWDVSVHAHGSTEDLRLDLVSDPPLDQEDIVLLLTVGMTRAEIDRGLASSLGETVGLEALSSLTGADKAVKSVVPIIDYFHFGSGYSARTGRTEPNVTVGKRLTDDVRASVTTTLTERDVGATLEWRLRRGVSVQASYDNTNDIGTIIGNLGADLRWRLEFE